MSEDTAKIRLKVGQFEFEYEGKSSFLEDGLVDLLEKTYALHSRNSAVVTPVLSEGAPEFSSKNQDPGMGHSTNTIATHIGVQSTSDLTIAAAAHLALVQKKPKFSRAEILAEMQGATTFYNKNMRSNLSKALASLVKNKRLNLLANHTYALSANEKKALEVKLAEYL